MDNLREQKSGREEQCHYRRVRSLNHRSLHLLSLSRLLLDLGRIGSLDPRMLTRFPATLGRRDD